MLLQFCIAFSILVMFLGGCATPSVRTIEKSDYFAKLYFLVDGKTTREDVILRLGEPTGIFEGERIFTYILVIDNEDKLHVLPRQFALNVADPRLYSRNPLFFPSLRSGKNEAVEPELLSPSLRSGEEPGVRNRPLRGGSTASVCSLVLVFRIDNVLEKHSLVGTKDLIR